MTRYQNVLVNIDRMVCLLEVGEANEWAKSLRSVSRLKESDAKILYNTVLGMYGGVGSLNDVVLYSGGKVLIAESNEFDMLRSELYDLCFG
ncbi:hypothetical protein HCU66_07360 [Pseudomonas frederiksbergensis]|uniref:DUF6966 domain-containing protein n=1 Tax=Pseudomonas frederiksbergensis TaxID=104087 RepID=UPI0019805704|nr:hypothetical protein [Pseudomonas frederiksbergensis]MBN3862045.1 hypothetical protein [Pseudomonas frederiksbergensis]